MSGGFLGYPSTLMLDVVVCALVLVIPALGYSMWLVRVKRDYARHRVMQLILGVTLLVTVVLFEIDMRLAGGWRPLLDRREVPLTPTAYATAQRLLYVHIGFACAAVLTWIASFAAMWRVRGPIPDGRRRRVHHRLGWSAVLSLAATAVTGVAWYGLAFVA